MKRDTTSRPLEGLNYFNSSEIAVLTRTARCTGEYTSRRLAIAPGHLVAKVDAKQPLLPASFRLPTRYTAAGD